MKIVEQPSHQQLCELGAGGKAEQLARLATQLRVPPFYVVITEGLEDALEEADRLTLIAGADRIGGDTFAVRSSANVEDSDTLSFAGQFETRLGVPRDQIPEAVEYVAGSATQTRVREYCKANGFDTPIRISVIVQSMIRAERAGVAFSWIDDSHKTICVEAIHGLGGPLVSGAVTPDHFEIDRQTLKITGHDQHYQSQGLFVHEDGLVKYDAIDPYERCAPKLSSTEVRVIVDALLKVEETLANATGVDMEWAIDSSGFVLLQARPMTGVLHVVA